jgi:hypothetical protein
MAAGGKSRKTDAKAAMPTRSDAPSAKPGAARPKKAVAARAKPRRSMPVHALADERVHLAPAQPGRLRQGYLKTLCELQAVSALSPFALADKAQQRCRICFGKVDSNGAIVP